MVAACPHYWDKILRRPKYKNLFKQHDDLARQLELVHETARTFAVRLRSRRASNHAEGMLAAQAKLHKSLVEAYDWHLAAAQLELRNMRRLAEELQSNACYMHCDFMEKLPIPISGSETSDMFHGSARKTLSVLAAYTVQVDKHGKRDVSATVLVSEIISALFSGVSACCRPSSRSRMWVHFKSSSLVLIPGTIRYENLYYFLHKLTKEYKQRTRVNYLVEKHGKAMCDSEVFAPIRRWIDEFLLHPKAFCDSETEVVNILSAHARREMSQNPTGTRFHIEVFHPPKPATSHTLVMDEEFITRSYSWVAVPTQNKRAPVQIYNTAFSHLPPQDAISYALAEKPPEKGEWKNASGWTRRGAETPLHLGKTASWCASSNPRWRLSGILPWWPRGPTASMSLSPAMRLASTRPKLATRGTARRSLLGTAQFRSRSCENSVIAGCSHHNSRPEQGSSHLSEAPNPKPFEQARLTL